MPQRLFVLFGLLAVLVVTLSWSETGRATAAQTLEPIYPTLPDNSLMFIENVGQFAAAARFQVRGSNHTIWLAEDAIWVTLLEPAGTQARPHNEVRPHARADIPRRGVNLRLSFVGANPTPLIEASDPISTTISYFLGNDPAGWQPDVPVWGSVRYADLYPDLDLELVGQGSPLTSRLVCHAADCATALASVQLEVAGAEELTLVEEGLVIETAVGEWRLPLLAVVDETGRPVEMNVQEAAVVRERVERPFVAHPAGYPLFPVAQTPNSPAGSSLLYSTFLGGSNSDYSRSITIDAVGNMFVAGFTQSADFPTTPGAFDTSYEPSSDSFVVKLNAAGTDLLYSTFVGGYGGEEALRIHVDAAGNAIFSGQTGSPDFPVTPDALDSIHNGGLDVYVAKLNATGSELLYGTFLGGSQFERGYGGTMDKAGRVYVTGYTVSPEFPTTPGAFDTTHNGNSDVFVLKMMLSEFSTQLFLPQVLASE